MITWIKRLAARKELDELDRWNVYWHETYRWLAEFHQVKRALDYLQDRAKGFETIPDIREIRDTMRAGAINVRAIHHAQTIRDAALEEAAKAAMNAPITAGMEDSDEAQALAFHVSAKIRALKSKAQTSTEQSPAPRSLEFLPNRQNPCCWRCFNESGRNFVKVRMFVCPTCGNKHCPKASDHTLACTPISQATLNIEDAVKENSNGK